MSDPKQPELTPKEQQAQDHQRVQNQLIVTDVNRQVQEVMDLFPLGGSGPSGRTSFEGHELNAMIDLIENSNPEHLENAGEALLKARTAIKDAAKELGDFLRDVDWEGESGIAFRDWGKGLVAHATKLGDFAEAAGTQITVAGAGLASVRKSLPPRDSRLVRKSVDEIETPKRIDGNPEYAAAVKVEKDRQEAINQANRLASYYSVSEETLAAQEPPRFEKKLDVAMPKPLRQIEKGSEPNVPSASSEELGSRTAQGHSERGVSAATGTPGAPGNRAEIEALGTAPTPDTSTSTEIDSVKAPPAPVTVPDVSPAPPTANPTGPSAGPNPPMVNQFVNPVTGGSRRSTPPTGLPRAVGQPGRSGPTSSGPTATGRTGAPVGRPAPIGGGPGSGPSGRPGGGGSQPPAAGRTSVTGGRPTAGSPTSTSKSPGPRTGRARAIMGGTPQRTAPGTDSTGGTRGVPRATVIGAGGTNTATRPGGRGTPSSKGVVGTPRSAAGSGSGSRGFTAGGAGLVRGPVGRQDSNDEDQDGGAARPDYLVEDRETWEAGRRGAAPPVIE
ncbi:hypothetical protein ACGF8B_40490 [Streptomyces sp. NPDC047917]|uniref:hypothetical protein n=1 Tax=Streptomyces sp. NPDC047917 TaxID=3365491 RepID=UPI00371104D1